MIRIPRLSVFAAPIPALIATLIAATPLFVTTASAAPAPREPADIVQERYIAAAQTFHALTTGFRNRLDSLPATAAGADTLRSGVARLRAAYKELEFLIAYLHPGSAARLNPPPLNRADMTSPDALDVIPPEGLQALLEAVHEDEPLSGNDGARARLRWLALRLELAARELTGKTAAPVLDDRMLFEAMQNQVVRVMAAGITGFDAPATHLALPEARGSLEALRPVAALYAPALRRRDAALARRLERAFDAAVAALPRDAEAGDFDAFDRLSFIRDAGDPLYAALVDAQRALGIATFDDLAPLRRPVSTTARGLFDPDFLDPHFYSFTPTERPDEAAAALGRRLFFDTLLSGGGMSCASCHDPRRAFSDGLAKSAARGGGSLRRNAPGLSFAGYQGAQFWDLRAPTLEAQINHVVHGEKEFASDFLSAQRRLAADSGYRAAFEAAFAVPAAEGGPVTVLAMNKALAMYMRTLGRWNSPFDRYVRGETEFLDPAAKRGFNLFMGKAACATCHFPPAFNGVVPPRYTDTESEVLGVPERFPAAVLRLDPDPGRNLFHFNRIFRNAFKTPTVRNAELTAPYMHNGGMETLEAVMDFYNAGGGEGLGLDVPNQTLPPDSLGLTRREMDDVVAFMKSLTDTTGYGAQSPGPETPRTGY